jgi:hypothetical protein
VARWPALDRWVPGSCWASGFRALRIVPTSGSCGCWVFARPASLSQSSRQAHENLTRGFGRVLLSQLGLSQLG